MTTPEERIRAATAGVPAGGPPMPVRDDREYVTIKEAQRLVGVQRRTIMGWFERGLIQRFKGPNGFTVLIEKEELMSYDRFRRTSKSGRAPVVIDGKPRWD